MKVEQLTILQARQNSFKDVVFAIETTFPFLTRSALADFRRLAKRYYKGLGNISSDDALFFLYLERFLALLRNSHTKLGNYPTKQFFKPRHYAVVLCKKRFFLQRTNSIVGEILSIDGRSPRAIFYEQINRISSSTKHYSTYRALQFLLVSQKMEPVHLRLNVGKRVKLLKLKREKTQAIPLKQIVTVSAFKNHIGYLRIVSWDNVYKNVIIRKLKQAVSRFSRSNIKALIIDVRGNGGGNSEFAKLFASHLFDKKVLFSITKSRVSKFQYSLKEVYSYVEPQKPFIDIPILLLVDAVCFSSTEYFVGGLRDNNRALLIGGVTGGGSGNPKKFTIPYRDSYFELFVSTWIYYRANRIMLEGTGIDPHIVVSPTLSSIRNSKDLVLARALLEAKRYAALMRNVTTLK